jgi:BirA family transcriptional regulator, biotin operon repressor / biotin---[acetyl-CoA-carboxylase] ligase
MTLDWRTDELAAALAPVLPGLRVEVQPEIGSTNGELMARARAGRTEAGLLVAERQTAGRGRLGRAWFSDAGAPEAGLPALTFSLGLPLAPPDWSGLSLAVGVAVAESIDSAVPPRITLKWPNDLWLDGRKLGGILIETASLQEAAPRYVVIGVGLNLAPRAAEGLATPPAWLRELRPQADAPALLHALAPALLGAVLRFSESGFAPFTRRFAARDALAGQAVVLSDGTAGRAEGVGEDGALRVRTAAGLQRISSAELSVRPTGAAA